MLGNDHGNRGTADCPGYYDSAVYASIPWATGGSPVDPGSYIDHAKWATDVL